MIGSLALAHSHATSETARLPQASGHGADNPVQPDDQRATGVALQRRCTWKGERLACDGG